MRGHAIFDAVLRAVWRGVRCASETPFLKELRIIGVNYLHLQRQMHLQECQQRYRGGFFYWCHSDRQYMYHARRVQIMWLMCIHFGGKVNSNACRDSFADRLSLSEPINDQGPCDQRHNVTRASLDMPKPNCQFLCSSTKKKSPSHDNWKYY